MNSTCEPAPGCVRRAFATCGESGEAIHPFLDGNGRLRRILVPLRGGRSSSAICPSAYMSDRIFERPAFSTAQLAASSDFSALDRLCEAKVLREAYPARARRPGLFVLPALVRVIQGADERG